MAVAGVTTGVAALPDCPFTGLSPRCLGKLVTMLRRESADAVRRGRPLGLPLEDRVLLLAEYWRTNLTLRQLAPPFGISKPAAERIINHLGPLLTLRPAATSRPSLWRAHSCGSLHDRQDATE